MKRKQDITETNNSNGKSNQTIKIVVALIGVIAVIVVGYWQYVRQPRKPETIRLTIFAKDAKTGRGIPNASVILDRKTSSEPKNADGFGLAVFELSKDMARANLTVSGEAPGYERSTVTVDIGQEDTRKDLPVPDFPFPSSSFCSLGRGGWTTGSFPFSETSNHYEPKQSCQPGIRIRPVCPRFSVPDFRRSEAFYGVAAPRRW